MWASRLVLFAMVAVLCVRAEERKDFQVRPGVDDSVSITVGSATCSFAWKGVSGGTGEKWLVRFDGHACLVGRTLGDSYLLFKWFEVTVGPGDADIIAFNGTGKELLRGTEYEGQRAAFFFPSFLSHVFVQCRNATAPLSSRPRVTLCFRWVASSWRLNSRKG